MYLLIFQKRSDICVPGGGTQRGKVIMGLESWSEPQTLKYTIF